jgi:hypothetical protein
MSELLAVVAEAEQALAEGDVVVDVDCARLGRQIRHSARGVIGLLPAGPDPLVQPFARQLGFALSRLTQALTLVLDPEQGAGFSPALADPSSSASVYVACPAPSVAIVAPHEVAPVGAKFEMVRVLLHFVEERLRADGGRKARPYGHVLVDLTGCARPGELLGALALLEGIIVVGRAGRVREKELEATLRDVPADLALGVMLTE